MQLQQKHQMQMYTNYPCPPKLHHTGTVQMKHSISLWVSTHTHKYFALSVHCQCDAMVVVNVSKIGREKNTIAKLCRFHFPYSKCIFKGALHHCIRM